MAGTDVAEHSFWQFFAGVLMHDVLGVLIWPVLDRLSRSLLVKGPLPETVRVRLVNMEMPYWPNGVNVRYIRPARRSAWLWMRAHAKRLREANSNVVSMDVPA
jgi:hypothetical protein